MLFYCFISAYTSYNIDYLENGVSLYGGLFNITSITHTFQIFIFIICGIILSMTAFYPRKRYISNDVSLLNMLTSKVKEYGTIINKTAEQFTIIEYTLIIIFTVTD